MEHENPGWSFVLCLDCQRHAAATLAGRQKDGALFHPGLILVLCMTVQDARSFTYKSWECNQDAKSLIRVYF
jgi:hypothetical protein